MPGTTPVQGNKIVDSSNLEVDLLENEIVDFNLNNTKHETSTNSNCSLSSICSSMSPPSQPAKITKWNPIKREVSHWDTEPSNPHPVHSDAAVKVYHSVTNSPNQVWVSGPPTPPTGEVTPNTLAIN